MSRALRLPRYLVNILVIVFLIGIATNVLYIGRDKRVLGSSSREKNADFGWKPMTNGASVRKRKKVVRVQFANMSTLLDADSKLRGMSWLSDLPPEPRHSSKAVPVPKSVTELDEHILNAGNVKSGATNSESKKEQKSWLPSEVHSKAPSLPSTVKNEADGCCRVTWDGPKDERSIPSCVDTCLTPRACHDPVFPYSSTKEKDVFSPWMPSDEEAAQLKELCDEFMIKSSAEETRLSSPRWCQQTDSSTDEEQGIAMNLANIPTGCSRFGMAALSGPFDRTFVFPVSSESKKRLAFCAIPKVGMTQWLQFLRYTAGAVDYQSVPHWKDDVMRLMRFDRMRPETQLSILHDTNNSWTKAVFLRDPAERLLSSYLDKVQDKENSTSTFESFVRGLAAEDLDCVAGTKKASKEGLTWCSDPHWRPQVWSCGLWELLPHFEFVGAMTDHQVDIATRALLQTVGLWESHGKHYRTGISGPGQQACALQPPLPLAEGKEPLGFQQRASATKKENFDSDHGNMYGHSKHSKTKLQQYYTEEVMTLVKELYASDYLLWNALQAHSQDGWATGKDLAVALNPSCKFK